MAEHGHRLPADQGASQRLGPGGGDGECDAKEPGGDDAEPARAAGWPQEAREGLTTPLRDRRSPTGDLLTDDDDRNHVLHRTLTSGRLQQGGDPALKHLCLFSRRELWTRFAGYTEISVQLQHGWPAKMSVEDAKQHIERIRQEKFGFMPDGTKRPNALERDLRAALKNLAEELNAKETHFILELLQNAEDNTYPPGVEPALSLAVVDADPTSSGGDGCLCLQNNETGFTPPQVLSLCSVGQSTKAKALGYIGEKGIGFKSVFRVTNQPHIFSNSFRFRFERPHEPDDLGYIVPHWVEFKPEGIASGFTAIYLPLIQGKRVGIAKKLSEILPETVLFLSKLRRLQIGSDQFVARDRTEGLVTLSTTADESLYLVQRQLWSAPDGLVEEKRPGIREREVTVALPLKTARQCRGRVFAFLPTEMDTGLPFFINADFLLTSSRDSLLEDRRWNQWLRDRVAPTFVKAFLALHDEPTWRYEAYQCIPIKSDLAVGAEFFAPVVDAVLEELKHFPCVVSVDGERYLPSQVYFAGPLTRHLLADAPLRQHSIRLIHTALESPTYRKRLGQPDGLGVASITFFQIFAACGDFAWLNARSLDWWETLFDLLVQCGVSTSTIGSFPLLLCQDGVCRPISAGVFLHPDEQLKATDIPPDWPPVHLLHAKLQARIWQKPQTREWINSTLGLLRFSVTSYITGHLLDWMRRHTGGLAAGRYLEATRFIALNLTRPEDYKETLREKLPWLLADQQVLLPESRGDKELVTPECLENDTGWNWVFISPHDRQHFWLLSNDYVQGQPDAIREAVRKLMGHCGATDLPDPAKLCEEGGRYNWQPPRWLRDLCRDQPPTNLERKVAALERWIGRFKPEFFAKFLRRGTEWAHGQPIETQLSYLGIALRDRPWLRSSKGCVAPTIVFADDPEIRDFLGESVAYTKSDLPRLLLERLGVRFRLTAASLIGELRRMRDSGLAKASLVVRIYRRLQTEAFNPDSFRNERLIYLTEPGPRWCLVDETVWKDLGEPFDPYFGIVERTYGEEDLQHFFTHTLGTPREPSLRKLVEIWVGMSSAIPENVKLAEGRMKEILRRCAGDVDELKMNSWWSEMRPRLAVWTTTQCFARPESVFAPDDGFAEQTFAGKVTIAWGPNGLSSERLAMLLSEVGCRSLAGEMRSGVDSTGETVTDESPNVLTQASKELLLLWLFQEKGWEKRKSLLESLIKSTEVSVKDLAVVYSLNRLDITISRATAAFWSAGESRLLFDFASSPESRRAAAAKSVAAGLRRITKDDEDTAYRLLMQSATEAHALAAERKWSLPLEASNWLKELGLQIGLKAEVCDVAAPTSRGVRPRLTPEREVGVGEQASGVSSTGGAPPSSNTEPPSVPSSGGSDTQRRVRSNSDTALGATEAALRSGSGTSASNRQQRNDESDEATDPELPQLKSPDDEDAEVHVAAHTRSRPGGRRSNREARTQEGGNAPASSPLSAVSQHRKSEIEDMAVQHALRQFEIREEFRGFHPIDVRRNRFGYDLLVHGPAGRGFRIEIKAHQSDPSVVFITKNEWDESRRTGGRGYRWELWNVCNLASSERVKIVRYSQIPDDAIYRESGYWVDLARCTGVSSD